MLTGVEVPRRGRVRARRRGRFTLKVMWCGPAPCLATNRARKSLRSTAHGSSSSTGMPSPSRVPTHTCIGRKPIACAAEDHGAAERAGQEAQRGARCRRAASATWSRSKPRVTEAGDYKETKAEPPGRRHPAGTVYVPLRRRWPGGDSVEFGLFNSACVLPQFDGDEHRRIMDEVAIVQAADRVGFKYTWATEHHFLTEYSHLSANEVFLGYLAAATERIHLGSGIFNITPPVNHPARIAERVAMLDHLSRGPLRVRHGSRLVDHRAARVRHRRPRPHARHVRRGRRRVPHDVARRGVPGLRRQVLLDAGAQRAAEAVHASRTRRCGSRPGNPSTFEKAARMGLGVLCFTIGGAGDAEAAHRALQEGDRERRAGRRLRERQHHGHDAAAVPRRRRSGRATSAPTWRWATTSSLLFRYLDTFPRPTGIPEWPELIPDPTPGRDRRARSAAGDDAVRHARRGRRSRSAKYADAGVDQVVFGLLSSTMDRELAIETIETFGKHVLPAFDNDPVHRTTRQREAAR